MRRLPPCGPTPNATPFKPGTIVAIARGLAVRHAVDHGGLRFYRVQLVDA
jgi:hypothetical protein